jgi:hypothetical protein
MGTIATTLVTPLSVLTAPGAPLASGSSLIAQSVLNSASPTDLTSLSAAATALSEADGLFGLPSPNYGGTTPDFFQSIDSSITDAAFGLTPAALSTTAPPSLDQLLSSYSAPTNNTGTVINTTG